MNDSVAAHAGYVTGQSPGVAKENNSFSCRFCLGIFHEEEACFLPGSIASCDVCREEFDASDLCWNCYMLPYPLRCCAECINPDDWFKEGDETSRNSVIKRDDESVREEANVNEQTAL